MQTIEPKQQYRLEQIPKSGQLLMYVELTAIKGKSISESLALLEAMGYEPQLRYLDLNDGLHLYALLRDEQLDPAQLIDDNYRLDERIALFEAFPGDEMVVHCATGLPARIAA
jgi:hypothetical protein